MKSKMNRFYTQPNEYKNHEKSSRVKLRTIFKSVDGRMSQKIMHENFDNKFDQVNISIENHKKNQFHDGRIRSSKSVNLQTVQALPQVKNHHYSIGKNVIKKLETMQPESQSSEFQQLLYRLSEMDREADQLIKSKIIKISKRQNLLTLKNRGKDQITQKIEALVAKIKKLDISKLSQLKQAEMKIFTDKKIKLLQKLMAETTIQSQVLKKYFFAISAMNQKKRLPQMLNSSNIQINTPRNKRVNLNIKRNSVLSEGQAIFNKSSNQMEYNSPKPNQYQTYRYKQKDYIANNQPFPRSIYKCQFLINPKIQNFSCKNMDNHGLFGKSRFSSSTYSKDFQRVKTEMVDIRQLDSYRNKIKKIQVSYNFKNTKQQLDNLTHRNRKYLQEQLKMRYQDKHSTVPSACIQQQALASVSSALLLTTQNHTKFAGEKQLQQSSIKHKQLDNLKYSYKSLMNN